MSGFNRRHKPIKAGTPLNQIDGVVIVNPTDGDLLVFDETAGEWENTHALVGDYTLAGSLTLTDLVISDDLTVTDDLSVGGDAFVTGDLAVTDDFSADAASLNSLNVAGAAVLASTLSIAGTLSGAGFSFSGSGTITGDLTVDDITVDVLTATSLSIAGATFGNLHVTGPSFFDDDAAFGGNVSVVGNIGVQNLSAAGDLLVGDTALVGTSLQVGPGFGSPSTVLDIDSLDWFNAGALIGRSSMTTASVWTLALGATPETALDATVNGAVRLYYDNAVKLATTSGGLLVSPGGAGIIDMLDSGNTGQRIRLINTNGGVALVQNTSAGTPASGFRIYQTDNAGADEDTWIAGARNGTVGLYYNGVEAIRTADPATADEFTAAEILHANGSFYPVGLGIRPILDVGTNSTISKSYCGVQLRFITTAWALTTPADSDTTFPIGGVIYFEVGATAGTSTVVAGSGITLQHFTGAAINTGTRTLAAGAVGELRRRSATIWIITGVGIT